MDRRRKGRDYSQPEISEDKPKVRAETVNHWSQPTVDSFTRINSTLFKEIFSKHGTRNGLLEAESINYTPGKHLSSVNVRHRSGSLTEIHMHANGTEPGTIRHTKIDRLQSGAKDIFELRRNDMTDEIKGWVERQHGKYVSGRSSHLASDISV